MSALFHTALIAGVEFDVSLDDAIFVASSAPTIASLNFAQGDTAGGGVAIVITGANLSGATDVLIGGNHVAPSSSTPTTCTFVLPAHASGTVSDVAVTTPGGTSNALSFEYWTPAQVTGVDAYLDSNKGVSLSLGAVTTWADQSSNARSFTQGTGANRPTQSASVFGLLPSIHFSPQQWVTSGASHIALASGLSAFAVAKWTSIDNSAAGAAFGNAPLGLINDDTGGVVNHCLGASADALQYGNNAGAWVTYNRGSGLNDGTPRLFGWTHDSATNDLKAYVGAAQAGTTIAGVTYQGGAFPAGYNVIGVDFLDEDGWDGDVGAIVVVQGVIAGGDLTKLNAWAQQRFGTP